MNKSEFEELELQVQQSGLPLKLYLQQVGVSYSTYHYWRKKCAAEKDSLKQELVSIRRTTGFEPFYTPIATVTINLIDAVAIVLLNLYVAVGISFQIL